MRKEDWLSFATPRAIVFLTVFVFGTGVLVSTSFRTVAADGLKIHPEPLVLKGARFVENIRIKTR